MTKTLAAALAAVIATPAAAQVPPPAQALQRNPTANPDRINEEQRQRLQERAAPEVATPRTPEVEAPPAAATAATGQPAVRFTLTLVKFDPSSYLTRAELDALAQPLIGKEVTLDDLQKLVDAINALYVKRGLTTARAALPAQQIDRGIVEIRLVEGRIGATTTEGGSKGGRAQAQRHGALAPGSLAAPGALEQRLRRFNLNNDAQLRARLTPGAAYGTTDVALTVAEPARVSADLFTDNNGFASTGEAEVGAVVRGYRLLGGADRTSAVLVASRGVISANLALSAPLGDRFRVDASGSYGHTHVLFGSVAALDVTGSSYSFGGDVAALLVVTGTTTLTATASVQTSLSETDIAGVAVVRNRAVNSTLGISASYAVAGLSAQVQAQLTLAHVEERLSGTLVTPLLYQGSALLAAAIVPRVQARVHGDWQLTTRRNLPGILQYQFGGSRSARAFGPGVAAGDRGYSVAAELAYGVLWEGLQVEPYAFVDHAEASVPGQHFRGEAAGGGLNLTFAPHISVRGTVATDIGRAGLPRSTRAFVSTTLHI